MMHLKNKSLQLSAVVIIAAILTSFTRQPFVLNGGTINNPYLTASPNLTPPSITATDASGCTGTITYQWQQSSDTTNFIDVPNANGVNYQPTLVANTTYFRRKASCSAGGTAYTNVATVIIVNLPQ